MDQSPSETFKSVLNVYFYFINCVLFYGTVQYWGYNIVTKGSFKMMLVGLVTCDRIIGLLDWDLFHVLCVLRFSERNIPCEECGSFCLLHSSDLNILYIQDVCNGDKGVLLLFVIIILLDFSFLSCTLHPAFFFWFSCFTPFVIKC